MEERLHQAPAAVGPATTELEWMCRNDAEFDQALHILFEDGKLLRNEFSGLFLCIAAGDVIHIRMIIGSVNNWYCPLNLAGSLLPLLHAVDLLIGLLDGCCIQPLLVLLAQIVKVFIYASELYWAVDRGLIILRICITLLGLTYAYYLGIFKELYNPFHALGGFYEVLAYGKAGGLLPAPLLVIIRLD